MLNLNKISLHIDNKQILNNVSLSLKRGDTLSIIGPSGCGKSSLLLSIANINKISSGTISSSSSNISLILQNGGLFPWKSIRDNIQLALINKNLTLSEKNILIDEITTTLNINHIIDKFPNEISGGEKQRASVARTLVTNPDILLLDEPSSALDSMNKDTFQNLLIDLQIKYNLTFIIVTHNIEEAVFLGKKIAIMSHGEIKTILDNPHYGNKYNRENFEFYKKTLELRKLLKDIGGLTNG